MKKILKNWRKNAVMLLVGLMLFAQPAGRGMIVCAAASSGVSLSQTTLAMTPGTTKKLKLNGASSGVKWSSSNKNVAVVDSSGKVVAMAKGTAKIKAAYKGKKYACTVTVTYGTYTTSDGIRYKDASGSFGHTGRWYKKSISGGKYYFTGTDGSAVYFKVTGSKYVNISFVSNISVATPYFAYSVDGGSMKRQLITKSKISVGNNKTHYVRLVIDAMSENENRWAGEAGVGIKSITPVTKSGLVLAVKPQNAVVAFYGDSITQGVRALNMALAPSGTSATHSYAWYCAAQLDLVPYFAGYGGSGIIQPGSFNNCYNTVQSFSSGRKADSYDADVIVIEHGTNDVYTYGDIFVNEYKKVIALLHKNHPKAYIMVMIPFTQIHADEIRKAAASYNEYCTVVETSSWKISYTDGLHPNTSGAKTAGKNLAKKIAAIRKVSLK